MRRSIAKALWYVLPLAIAGLIPAPSPPAKPGVAADPVIEEQPVESNILSTEQAHPAPSRIDVTPVPPEPAEVALPTPPEATAEIATPDTLPPTVAPDTAESATVPEAPPPADTPDTEAALRQAMAAGDATGLIGIAREHPDLFSCTHLDSAWALADAYAAMGRSEDLFDLAARLIDNCQERDRLVTLQKAGAWLDTDAWERLMAREMPNPRTPEVAAEFKRLRYDHASRQMLTAKESRDTAEFSRRLAALSPEIEAYQDAGAALLAGWTLLEAGDTVAAASWFGKADNWQPDSSDAVHGLALCALAERRFLDARTLALRLPEALEGRTEVLRSANLGLAEAEYAEGNTAATLRYLHEAGTDADLPRYAQLLEAWATLRAGEGQEARKLFQAVHAREPDGESAQGFFNALVATGAAITPDSFPDDPWLEPLVQDHLALQAFAQNRFLTARDLAPDHYTTVGGPGSPRVDWHVFPRDKSGVAGSSALTDTVTGLEAVWPVTERSELHFRLDHHWLDSGASGPDVDVWEPHLQWRGESRFDVEADLGFSVPDRSLDPRVMGYLSLSDSGARGNFTLTGYARPIRESILSFTGWRQIDGGFQGGARAFGVEGSGYLSLGQGFGFNGGISLDHITGDKVRDNDHVSLRAGANRDLGLGGFKYFATGISVAYDHYRHNLSLFTPGHGGYFSPQAFMQAKANLDFQTREDRRGMLRGHFDAGRVFKHEEAPLPGSGYPGVFADSRAWGWAYSIELEGVVKAGGHLQLGTQISYRVAPQYDELAGMVFVRLLLEERTTVLSSDLSGRLMNALR